MALNARQDRLYESTCDIWAPSITVTGGVPGATSYSKAASNVRYHRETSPSISDVLAAGRMEADLVYTMDKLHFATGVAIDDTYVVVDKSLDADGAQADTYGRAWIVRGNPKINTASARRRTGKIMVEASQLPSLPTGVTV